MLIPILRSPGEILTVRPLLLLLLLKISFQFTSKEISFPFPILSKEEKEKKKIEKPSSSSVSKGPFLPCPSSSPCPDVAREDASPIGADSATPFLSHFFCSEKARFFKKMKYALYICKENMANQKSFNQEKSCSDFFSPIFMTIEKKN